MTALDFNAGPGLDFGTSADYGSTSELTIAGRIFGYSFASDYRELIRKAGNYILRTGAAGNQGKWEWAWWDGTNIRWQHGSSVITGAWSTFLVTVTKNDCAGIFVNGISVGDASSTLAPEARSLTNALLVGNSATGGIAAWNSRVEDLAIWDVAMGQEDAEAHAGGVLARDLIAKHPIFYLERGSGIRDVARQTVPTIYSSCPAFIGGMPIPDDDDVLPIRAIAGAATATTTPKLIGGNLIRPNLVRGRLAA